MAIGVSRGDESVLGAIWWSQVEEHIISNMREIAVHILMRLLLGACALAKLFSAVLLTSKDEWG